MLKYRVICIIALLFLTIGYRSAEGQSYNYEWAASGVGSDDDRGNKLSIDGSGNAIVVGRFRSKSLAFGEFTLTNSDQDSSTSDIFIVKFNPSGKVSWARSFGGYGDEFGNHCSVDHYGNIIFVGGFDCKELQIGKFKLKNEGEGSDIVIAKFNESGDVIWAKAFGGSKSDGGYLTCAVDKDNNIFITGGFQSDSISFGASVLRNSSKWSETFVAKLSPDGDAQWAKSARGVSYDESQGCEVDIKGNLVVAGYYVGDSISFDNVTLRNNGKRSSDIFLVKYSTDGTLLWARNFGGPKQDLATCKVDSKGNIIIAGLFSDSLLVLGKSQLITQGSGDIFLAKLRADGEVIWAKSVGGKGEEGIRNFCVDSEDNIIVTGGFESKEIAFGKSVLTNSITETEDVFIASYSPKGKVLWAQGTGGAGRNVGRYCSTDKVGNVYLTGSFVAGTLNFGKHTLINSGGPDVFLVKLAKGN